MEDPMTVNNRQPLKLWNRNFILVAIGQVISLFGNAILRFALPLYLLRETGSAALFGVVTAVAFLPMIFLSFLGGVLADRVNKRNIMVALDFITGIVITAFLVALGTMPLVPLMIVVLMALYGIGGVYHPTVQASIPLLVENKDILKANAIVNQVSSLSTLLGPVIGGMLFGVYGIIPILVIGIFCFMLSAVMELFIRMPYYKRETDQGPIAIIRADFKDSAYFIRKEKPTLIQLFMLVALHNMITSSMLLVSVPIIIINSLGLSDALLGYAQGAVAFGGLIGGMITMIYSGRLKLAGTHYRLFVSSGLVLMIAIALLLNLPAMAIYGTIVVASFGVMVMFSMFGVQMMAHIQIETPPELVGKVIALLLSIVMIAQPAGQAIFGFIFEAFGNRPDLIMLGVAIASFTPVLISKMIFRNMVI
jgi:MFS family permease